MNVLQFTIDEPQKKKNKFFTRYQKNRQRRDTPSTRIEGLRIAPYLEVSMWSAVVGVFPPLIVIIHSNSTINLKILDHSKELFYWHTDVKKQK